MEILKTLGIFIKNHCHNLMVKFIKKKYVEKDKLRRKSRHIEPPNHSLWKQKIPDMCQCPDDKLHELLYLSDIKIHKYILLSTTEKPERIRVIIHTPVP